MMGPTNGEKMLMIECGYWFVVDPKGRILWDSQSDTKAEAWHKATATAEQNKFRLLLNGVRVRQATMEDVFRPHLEVSA